MKALTIKSPWAMLIAMGIKDIENRTWRTKYRGRIYIHVAKSGVKGFLSEILTDDQYRNSLDFVFSDHESLPYGAIIGEVDIVGCVIGHSSIWAEHADMGAKPIWNWVLANPVLYDKPIENVKGALSLWDYTKFCPSCKTDQPASNFCKGDDECAGCLYLPY